MRLLLIMMALAQCGELLAQQGAAAAKQQVHVENLKTASNSLNFVNKMREDLRRNNDDYALLEGQNRLEQPPRPAHPAPEQSNRKRLPLANRLLPPVRAGSPHHNYDTRRGKGAANQDIVIQGHVDLGTVNQGDLYNTNVKQGNVNKVAKSQGDVTQSNQSATEYRTFTHAKHMKSLRVSKLKKLLQRDKDKLRERDTKQSEAEDMKSFTLQTTITTRLATPAPPPPSPPRRTRMPRPSAILRNGRLREKHSPTHQNLEKQNPLHENIERQIPPREDTEQQSPLHEDMQNQNSPGEDTDRQSPLHEEMHVQDSPGDDTDRQSPLHEYTQKQNPPGEDIDRQSPLHEDEERQSHPHELMERQNLPRRPVRNPAPLPDQIDMAHARNPLITRIRLKGRLCQRSLMNIEGPTYDRDGKQVLPEHDPRLARGRLFHQTRAPDLVLPKCCNCCKKSVLGCQ